MSKIIEIDGAPLLLFTLPSGVFIESYELALFLGYVQPGSIRKQVLSDWKGRLSSPKDYALVHDSRYLEKYEARYAKEIGPIKAVKEKRGRLFLTPSGVKEVLARTSKEKTLLEGTLLRNGFLDVSPAQEARAQSTPRGFEPDPVGTLVDLKHSLIETRKFNYQVLQTLLSQLNELQDDDLKLLAIEAAEIALGRSMPDLRVKYTRPLPASKPPSSTQPPVKLGTPDGPVFTQAGFYGLKQIGEMAGGYTSVTAGKAANNVAEAMGYSAEEIRSKQLDFNELPILPDSTTGKPRKMYRFNLMFSNMVIRELRENAGFRPRAMMPLTSFSSGGGTHPKLSQGPFSDEAH